MPKKSKSKPKQKILPLLEELRSLDRSLFANPFIHPAYITENMKHTFRNYQANALRYFHYTHSDSSFANRNIKHVLFNMATGSGKTDLMAGLILYLFKERGYQNFLFIVNTDAVLKKTMDNLTNPQSAKYLFAEAITIDGARVSIQRVATFPREPQKNVIYIKLSTVQKLSSDISESRENAVGIKDFARNDTIILGDEAHHFNASTKAEREDENSWEYIIHKILQAREKNLLLEFTATMDFDKSTIYEKYKDKVVYQYGLDKFISDGFSKNVKRIQNDNDDETNMMNAVLLSEFRKIYAREVRELEIKPVILFKSAKIGTSLSMTKKFNEMIESLSVESLNAFVIRQKAMISEKNNATLSLAYDYYVKPENQVSAVAEIKRNFSARNVLNANDTDRTKFLEKGQYELLNSLESPANPIRAVFAVAKLTEGWDVLNLYDIVRIKENAGTNAKATDSEAQLVGRGARYNPLVIKGEKKYIRQYDQEFSDSPSLLLETLHYHTMNEPQYLKNLNKSLNDMDLPTEEDAKQPLLDVKVKASFKRTETYNYGNIFYNETKVVPEANYQGLRDYGIDNQGDIHWRYLSSAAEVGYRANTEGMVEERHSVKLIFDKRLVNKAMNRLTFYHFDNLKQFLPNLNSRDDFMVSEHWLNLAVREFRAELPDGMTVYDLSAMDKLKIMEEFLNDLELQIRRGFVKERGTNKFIAYPIKDYISDYKKRVKNSGTELIVPTPYSQNAFVYETAIINATERQLVERLLDKVDELKGQYDEVYLIRMDENMHRESAKSEKLKLHQFDTHASEIHLEGFQPDFILYLKNASYMMQIFIEPKGADRAEAQQWKEDLLVNLNQADLEFAEEFKGEKVRGVRFYLLNDERGTLNELAQIALDKDAFSKGSLPDF